MEGFGSIGAGDVVESDDAGTRIAVRTRFVEADVTGTTDTEELEIKSAAILDFFVVISAVGF